jgi:predicted molibdopterin-dependent oxidoreductase YjgC
VLGTLDDLPKADLALVVGTDLTPELPPLGWEAHGGPENENFKLIVANPRQTKFDRYADVSLRYKPGSRTGAHRRADQGPPGGQPRTGPGRLRPRAGRNSRDHQKIRPQGVGQPLRSGGTHVLRRGRGCSWQAKAPAIIFGTELLGQDKGEQTALALADLFLLIGHPGTPGSKLYPIAEKANTRGVCELGV